MARTEGITGPVVAALAALYVIWGTTYLGIREAVAWIPPLLMASIRFLVPAAGLYLFARLRGAKGPTRAMWLRAAVVGILMLTIGNGVVSLVETGIPSGSVALIVATVPLWIGVFEWVVEKRRPSSWVMLGIGLGIAGVAMLAADRAGWRIGTPWWWGVGLVLSSGCWALGSILARRPWPKPESPWMDLAMQMAAGGVALAIVGTLRGEWPNFHPSTVPLEAWLWVAYLSVFGSVIALGCYLWLLRVTSPALATTYAFVNPVVAVVVGAYYPPREPITAQLAVAALVIVAAVAIIVWSKARSKPDRTPSAAAER